MTRTIRISMVAGLFLTALAPLPAHADKGAERLWKAKCASCHGADGKGQTEQGQKLKVADYTTAAWQKAHTKEQIKKGIIDGVKDKKTGEEVMKGYADPRRQD